jgi:nucleoside-diphosphate-sugar epimerase
VRRLVHLSTFGVYDRRRPAAGPIAEDFPRGQGRGYGNYKAAKELILEAYAGVYGFELIVLRPANVFGLGHFWSGSSGGRRMQVLVEAALTAGTARIAASDAAANEYVYAKDVGRAVDLAATVAMPATAIFNIGNGYVTPFEDVLAALKGLRPDVSYEIDAGARPHENLAPLDISAAKRHLGWEPRFTIASALEDYVKELAAARAS